MPEPKISIVLPTYNGTVYLDKSIRSCLQQTYANIELIIVDDGSTDRTPELVAAFRDERIRYIRLEKNGGHIAALNRGFAASTGEFLTWTSDDNWYSPDAMDILASELVNSDRVDFVYSNYYVVDRDDKVLHGGRVEGPRGLDIDNYVGGCFLYRRKVYKAIGDFNPEAFLAEDYEYWLRVRRKFAMKKIEPFLYYYRLHEKSLTGTYKEEKVQDQVEKIRARFISAWKSDYLRAKTFAENGRPDLARPLVLKSFVRNPLHFPAWRLLAVLYMDPVWVEAVRKMKHALHLNKAVK